MVVYENEELGINFLQAMKVIKFYMINVLENLWWSVTLTEKGVFRKNSCCQIA